MDDFEKELKTGFLEEATQLLADAEQCFLDLETNPNDKSLIEKIFRLAHNLKGSAKAVGFSQMGEFTHELESLLLKLKNGELPIKTSTVSLLLKCSDHLQNWIKKLSVNFNEIVDCEFLLEQIKNQILGKSMNSEVSELELVAEKFDEIADSFPQTQEVQFTTQEVPNTVSHVEESIRVALPRLEKLMNNVGELVILQTVLNQQKYEVQSPLLQKTITQLSKITKDIQDISMGLRMLPLKQTFQKVQRIVRDTSKSMGKDIQLHIEGEETELDKTVVENLGDPLVHLVRNAVDHGIETSEERIKSGKGKVGNIFIKAFHSGGKIFLEIRDDGKGLNPQVLQKKAVEKGLISAQAQLTEKEAQNLIFAPGFSTKAEVTEISGRGVGMDVVKTNIEKVLRGEVSVQSEVGKGTQFLIQLPLTLAIIDGMIVSMCGDKYIVPLPHVHESVRLSEVSVTTVSGLGDVLSLRGEELPLYKLHSLLNKSVNGKSHREGIAIIVRVGASPFAIEVDDIIGQHQVVIKSLGQEIKNMKGIVGGAILGDGKAALILDLQELAQKSKSHGRALSPMRGAA